MNLVIYGQVRVFVFFFNESFKGLMYQSQTGYSIELVDSREEFIFEKDHEFPFMTLVRSSIIFKLIAFTLE